MNERIKECMFNAGLNSNHVEGFDSIYSQQLEKFAELIVEECMDVVGTAVDQREPASTYVGKIKQHFGVESGANYTENFKQPEALRIAAKLEGDAQGMDLGAEGMGWGPSSDNMRAGANELRRLHVLKSALNREVAALSANALDDHKHIQQLLAALKEITEISEQVDGWQSFPLEPIERARAAIAKATGEKT